MTRLQLNNALANTLQPLVDIPQHLHTYKLILDYLDGEVLVLKDDIEALEIDFNAYYTKAQADTLFSTKANVIHTHSITNITNLQSTLNAKADLVGGLVPANQLPSFVDDVLEFDEYADLPATGEKGKIYVTTDDNKTFRWTGTVYTEIATGKSYYSGNGISIDGASNLNWGGVLTSSVDITGGQIINLGLNTSGDRLSGFNINSDNIILKSVNTNEATLLLNGGVSLTATDLIEIGSENGLDIYVSSGDANFYASGNMAMQSNELTFDAINTLTLAGNTVVIDIPSSATGDMHYRNSSGILTRIPVGSNNQVLKLISGVPTWSSESGGTTIPTSANQIIVGTGTNTAAGNAGITYNGSLLNVSGIFKAEKGVSTLSFTEGNLNQRPTLSIINGDVDGRAMGVLAGTGGSAFVFDDGGFFLISPDTKANISGGVAGSYSGPYPMIAYPNGNIKIKTSSTTDNGHALQVGSGTVLLETLSGTGVRTVVTNASGVLSTKPIPYANVRDYGATGDGVTDDRTAFLAAIATGLNVYVPSGSYLISSAGSGSQLTLSANQQIFGDGKNSELIINNNTRLLTIANYCSVKNLAFKGSGKSSGNNFQTGIFVYETVPFEITNCYFSNFGGNPTQNGGGGVYIVALGSSNTDGGRVTNCYFTNNNSALTFGQRGEYVNVTGCNFGLNTCAIAMGAGNLNITTSVIQNNNVGIKVFQGTNFAHSTISSCLINHNVTPLIIEDVLYTLGMVISDCHFFDGVMSIKNSKNIRFVNCQFQVINGITIDNSSNLIRVGCYYGVDYLNNPIPVTLVNGGVDFDVYAENGKEGESTNYLIKNKAFSLQEDNTTIFTDLSGTGTRMVVASATGELSTQSIPSGGGSSAWGSITGTLSSQTDLQSALDAKQATLVSGTNVKTINGQSILGSGNISIATGSTANVDDGFYTPTVSYTTGTNETVETFLWSRVNNTYSVSGSLQADFTNSNHYIDITLPDGVTNLFVSTDDASGCGTITDTLNGHMYSASVKAIGATSNVRIAFNTNAASSFDIKINFMFRKIDL